MTMIHDRLQMGIDDPPKRHQIVQPEQATTGGDTLEVVHASQRCPANRYADKLCAIRNVADKRHPPCGHPVVDLNLVAAKRMKWMCDADPSDIARRFTTACIPEQWT